MRLKGLTVVRSGGPVSPLGARAADDDGDATETTDVDGMPVMEVLFSPFNRFYEINSWYEGRFVEKTRKGAFARTISNQKRDDGRSSVKVMFNHGQDFHIGQKLLGVASSLRERDDSPEMLVPLFDTSYNRDLVPGLREGAYGSSFMFEVLEDSWKNEPEKSEENPEGLPERTIHEVRLHEAGPVTWPANPAATAGLRSGCGTDGLMERLQTQDPDRFQFMVKSFSAFRSMQGLYLPDHLNAPAPDASSARHAERAAARAVALQRRRDLLQRKERFQ